MMKYNLIIEWNFVYPGLHRINKTIGSNMDKSQNQMLSKYRKAVNLCMRSDI